MFKSVTYRGFEDQPVLRAKVEELLPTLDAELDTRLGPIHVEWHYVAPAQVELSLFDEVIGAAEVGRFDPAEVTRNPRFFPAFVWHLYLDGLQKSSRRRIEVMKRNWAEPVGA